MASKEYDGVEVENQDVEKEHGVKKCTCKGPPTYICIYKQERGLPSDDYNNFDWSFIIC